MEKNKGGKDVKKLELSHIAGEYTNGSLPVEKSLAVSQKDKHRITIRTTILPYVYA
jgi:hypothetical protein